MLILQYYNIIITLISASLDEIMSIATSASRLVPATCAVSCWIPVPTLALYLYSYFKVLWRAQAAPKEIKKVKSFRSVLN